MIGIGVKPQAVQRVGGVAHAAFGAGLTVIEIVVADGSRLNGRASQAGGM